MIKLQKWDSRIPEKSMPTVGLRYRKTGWCGSALTGCQLASGIYKARPSQIRVNIPQEEDNFVEMMKTHLRRKTAKKLRISTRNFRRDSSFAVQKSVRGHLPGTRPNQGEGCRNDVGQVEDGVWHQDC